MKLFLFSLLIFNQLLSNSAEDTCLLPVSSLHRDEYLEKIISREEWQALPPKQDIELDLKKDKFSIHHSAVANASSDKKTVKGIQRYHMEQNGWSDIGYHFLIGTDGKCFEGREIKYNGAHTKGSNRGNIGICFLGCFESSLHSYNTPTEEMIASCSELIAILCSQFEIKISDKTIKAHNKYPKNQTLCPGDLVITLIPEIIERAKIIKSLNES